MIAVCDANVLASGFVGFTRTDSTPGEILRRWRLDEFTLVYSREIRRELERTLEKPYFRQRRTLGELHNALELLDDWAAQTELTVAVAGIVADPDDDHVLAAAISSSAEYLVTGDRELQALGTYQGVHIVSPREFLTILDGADRA